jgi:enoyl-CoA hydratase/carnithine racemase
MPDFFLRERNGAVLTLTMNRPESRNTLTDDTQSAELRDLCEEVNRDMSVKCVVLTGAGSAFCAGGNVKDMQNKVGIAAGSAEDIRNGYKFGIQRIPKALYDIEVPTIAAVNGPAIGAGCDLACMCDIRIASEKARFAESFVKIGIIPGDGGAWLLPRIVGMSRAAELTFTGDTIDAAHALAIGLVSRVVPPEQLLTAAHDLAARIVENSGPALRMSKKLMREGQHMRLDSLLEMSAAFQAICHHTPEHDDAVTRFVAAMKKPAK